MGEEMSTISIVHDLTKLQRAEEQKLFTEAKRKNDALSDQENFMYKVVGKRGERRIIRVLKKVDKPSPRQHRAQSNTSER